MKSLDENPIFPISAFGKAVLQCFGCILPFLDKDLIDNLPYLCASAISVLPPALHQDIVNSLCYYILPFTISKNLYDLTNSNPIFNLS